MLLLANFDVIEKIGKAVFKQAKLLPFFAT